MLNQSGKRLPAVAGFCLGLWGTFVAPAHGVEDVLEKPAIESDLAPDSLLLDVARAEERIVAVGERGHIVYSDNEGESWTQASVPVSTTLTGVHFPTEEEGWAVGHSGVILHSSDGGETWEHQFDGREGVPQVIDYYEQRIDEMEERIASTGDEDKVADLEWELEDLQFTHEDLKSDLEKFGPWHPLLDVWFENENHGFAVGAYGHIYRTRDGGETWRTHVDSIDNPDRFHLNGITEVPGGDLYIAGESGFVYRSTNNGETWEQIDVPYRGSFFGVVGTGEKDAVMAFGLKGNVYRSKGGDEWKSLETETSQTLNSGYVNQYGEVVVVGNDGALLHSNNGGDNFSRYLRSSRHSYVGVVFSGSDSLVLAGEKGAVRTDRQGRDLSD